MFNRNFFRLMVLFPVFAAHTLLSQIVLQGTVTDNGAEFLGNGAEPVAGALVTVTDQEDSLRTFSAYTDEEGHYSIVVGETAVDGPVAGPGSFRLLQNYPNPFNPSTVIGYELSRSARVTLEIYNVMGRKVRTLIDGVRKAPGQVIWDGTDERGEGVPAGIYIYSLKADGRSVNKKMLLVDGHQGIAAAAGQETHRIVSAGDGNIQKPVSDQYTLTVTGDDITAYEEKDLIIASSMMVQVSVRRILMDIDGNVYGTVKIGDQWWMNENLKVTHYRNKEAIPNVTGNSEWSGLSTGAWCVFENDTGRTAIFGCMYNWFAVSDSSNIAPEGWHVPDEEDWKELKMFLGMSQSDAEKAGDRGTNQGSKLAGVDTMWADNALRSDAEFGVTGFAAVPGGYRYVGDGEFHALGQYGYYWSATEGVTFGWAHGMCFDETGVRRNKYDRENGFSVRLIKDR